MDQYKIALSPGDTVGKELMLQVRKVLTALEHRFNIGFDIVELCTCGPALDIYGTAFRESDINIALGC